MLCLKPRTCLNLAITAITFITVNQINLKNYSIQANNYLSHASEIINITSTQNIEPEVIQSIKKLLIESIKASEAEDIEAGMAMMHPDFPLLSDIANMMEELILTYDFDYEYDNVEILEVSENEAKVKITQTTRKVAGDAEFRDNRTVVIQTLKKYNGEWKFFAVPQILNIEYL